MNAVQRHRGPDGQGVFEDSSAGIALGHVRLSILDLSQAGTQPMSTPDGRFVLVFNGEIYNFHELRDDLSAAGIMFRSAGDTEVLLHGLACSGAEYLRRLNGMYALALWDRQTSHLMLARDPLGIKPLYYAQLPHGGLVFASEIKALCAHPRLRREVDGVAIIQHLAYCHASGDRCALASVKRLRPGFMLQWSADKPVPKTSQFYNLPFEGRCELSHGDAVDRMRTIMSAAIRRQMVSDVPVGSLLSGGLDSSLITTFAMSEASSGFQSYNIWYSSDDNRLDQFGDDRKYARVFAARHKLQLSEIPIRPDAVTLWPKLIYHLDEPIADPAAIATHLIAVLAKEHGTTVLLSGQGADELYYGYPRYKVMHLMKWLPMIPRRVAQMVSDSAHTLPGAREGRIGAFLRRVRRVLTTMTSTPERRFLSYCANTPERVIYDVVSPDLKECIKRGALWHDCLETMRSTAECDGLARFRIRDLLVYLPNHNLLYTDKMSMAVGLEVRVPMLDLELVNMVLTFPDEWLVSGLRNKVILREAAETVVPREIIQRRKAGLGAPYRKWLRYDLEPLWEELTSEAAVRSRGWFDYKQLKNIRRLSQEGKADLYMLQWAVLTIELWARQFIDRNPVEEHMRHMAGSVVM